MVHWLTSLVFELCHRRRIDLSSQQVCRWVYFETTRWKKWTVFVDIKGLWTTNLAWMYMVGIHRLFGRYLSTVLTDTNEHKFLGTIVESLPSNFPYFEEGFIMSRTRFNLGWNRQQLDHQDSHSTIAPSLSTNIIRSIYLME